MDTEPRRHPAENRDDVNNLADATAGPLASPEPASAPPRKAGDLAVERLAFIDRLRGLVIVIMVLDHVRDFFSVDNLHFSATDLSKTYAALFFTRWITHLCAPTFVLLAGVSIYLRQQRRRGTRADLAVFLLTRGIWLIVLECTLVGFAFFFTEPAALLQVIWAIGMSFVLMAAVIALPAPAIFAIGVIITAGSGLLEPLRPTAPGIAASFWTLFIHGGGRLGSLPVFVSYPALPWFGVMALGYGAGWVVLLEPDRRDRWIVAIGVAMLSIFLLLRSFDGYGDPAPWHAAPAQAQSVLAFLNVSKYPPSLDFVLVTLGVVLVCAPWLKWVRGLPDRVLLTFGRVPLFVYVLHLYIAHGLALLVGLLMGIPAKAFTMMGGPRNASLLAAHWGFGLGIVYLAWLVVLVCLWPLAHRYAAFKARERRWWFSYI